MVALCSHNIPTYYAFYYAGIFDGGIKSTLYVIFALTAYVGGIQAMVLLYVALLCMYTLYWI